MFRGGYNLVPMVSLLPVPWSERRETLGTRLDGLINVYRKSLPPFFPECFLFIQSLCWRPPLKWRKRVSERSLYYFV